MPPVLSVRVPRCGLGGVRSSWPLRTAHLCYFWPDCPESSLQMLMLLDAEGFQELAGTAQERQQGPAGGCVL